MVERLKHEGTSHSSSDLLKIFVKMGACTGFQTDWCNTHTHTHTHTHMYIYVYIYTVCIQGWTGHWEHRENSCYFCCCCFCCLPNVATKVIISEFAIQ